MSPSEGEGWGFKSLRARQDREKASPEPAELFALASEDERWIARAIELANDAAACGDVPIGAVLRIGERRFEAKNEKELRPDATAHAEMLLIQQASRELGVWRLSDATLYITKEPCIMCAGAILAARIGRVVYGARDPKGGADGGAFDVLQSPKTNHRLDVTAGVLEADCAAQLQSYFRAKRQKPEGPIPQTE